MRPKIYELTVSVIAPTAEAGAFIEMECVTISGACECDLMSASLKTV
jgi:hypothetical protein